MKDCFGNKYCPSYGTPQYLLRKLLGKDWVYYRGDHRDSLWVIHPENAKFMLADDAEQTAMTILENTGIACEVVGPYQ